MVIDVESAHSGGTEFANGGSEVVTVQRLQRARALMAEALTLLEETTVVPAATYLELSIICLDLSEAMTGAGDRSEVGRFSRESATPRDQALVRAMGGMIAVIATILERNKIATLDDMANLLSIYSTTTGEWDPESGTIIACWHEILRNFAKYPENYHTSL